MDQYIQAQIFKYGDSFGRDKSFYPVWISAAYELDWADTAAECDRLVDAGILGRHLNGRYWWAGQGR